jgi:hypothetical protein
VALDSDQKIWNAFNNNAWPALYFVGSDGRVRRYVLGEGEYDKSERLIQSLLSETAGPSVAGAVEPVVGAGPEAPPDLADLASGETYVGYARASGFASFGGLRQDFPDQYRAPDSLSVNRWALGGGWTAGEEFATSGDAASTILYRFHARDLHLVMGAASSAHPVRFRVTLDGAPPGADHGTDVDAGGWGLLKEPRMYQLIRQTRPVIDRTFQIQFLAPGARAYDFTFG